MRRTEEAFRTAKTARIDATADRLLVKPVQSKPAVHTAILDAIVWYVIKLRGVRSRLNNVDTALLKKPYGIGVTDNGIQISP